MLVIFLQSGSKVMRRGALNQDVTTETVGTREKPFMVESLTSGFGLFAIVLFDAGKLQCSSILIGLFQHEKQG